MMNYRQHILGFFSLLLVACSDDNHDLTRYIGEVKQRQTKSLEPLPVVAPLPGFKFPDSEGRRNPFKVINQKKQLDSHVPDQYRIKQVLEAYPLEALMFVGTLTQGNQIWGLIKRPDTQITRVGAGDYMGKNYGRIVHIKNSSIILEETIRSISGGWEKHITSVEMFIGKQEL